MNGNIKLYLCKELKVTERGMQWQTVLSSVCWRNELTSFSIRGETDLSSVQHTAALAEIFELLSAVKWCTWEKWIFSFHLSGLSVRVYAVVLFNLCILLCYLVYTKSVYINPTRKREVNNFFLNVHTLSATMHITLLYATWSKYSPCECITGCKRHFSVYTRIQVPRECWYQFGEFDVILLM